MPNSAIRPVTEAFPFTPSAGERMIPHLGGEGRDPLVSLGDDVRRVHGPLEEAERLPATTPNSVTIDSAAALLAAESLLAAADAASVESVALEYAGAARTIAVALTGRRRRLH